VRHRERPPQVLEEVTSRRAAADRTLSVLFEVDRRVAVGESVALTGESGSGTSALLHLIAGRFDPAMHASA